MFVQYNILKYFCYIIFLLLRFKVSNFIDENDFVPRTRIGHQSAWFSVVFQKVDYFNAILFLCWNMVVIKMHSTDGFVESVSP